MLTTAEGTAMTMKVNRAGTLERAERSSDFRREGRPVKKIIQEKFEDYCYFFYSKP